jgi:hypothetical protein
MKFFTELRTFHCNALTREWQFPEWAAIGHFRSSAKEELGLFGVEFGRGLVERRHLAETRDGPSLMLSSEGGRKK